MANLDRRATEPVDCNVPPPPGAQWRIIAMALLNRARFVAILLSVVLLIGYWDTIENYWDKWTRPSNVAIHSVEAGKEFFCPMHPKVVSSTFEPNGDLPKCPICGMPLSLRKKGDAPPLPVGVTGRVQLSPERVQLAGIKTLAVEYRPMSMVVATVGYVAFDESRMSKIVSRVEGYVEKLYVNKTFDSVREGDPLADICSPDLFAAAQELNLAIRQGAGTDMAASARNKLALLGVGTREIEDIASSGRATPRLTIRSPRNGYVIEKKIVVGSGVEPRMSLFEVADLSKVWVEADVYEQDIALLRPGQTIEATIEALSNRAFKGRLAMVYPTLDSATRTNRIRLELDNFDKELRPGMYATVRINVPLESLESFKSLAATKSAAAGEFLSVPEGAVVDSGSKQVVYVEREPGVFEGRLVELGPRNGDYYPVIKGLYLGDRVAAAGGFLIDAETRLNPGAASTYFGASGSPQADSRPTAPSQSSAPAAATPNPIGPETPPAAAATPEDIKNINQLPEADRVLALAQGICPITRSPLGEMGVPIKITLRGQTVFLCCQGCIGKAKREPDATLKVLDELKKSKR